MSRETCQHARPAPAPRVPGSVGRLARRAPVVALAAGMLATVAAVPASASTGLGFDAATTAGSVHHAAAAIGAHDSYRAGFTGKGVDIAMIDTGVTEVPGLDSGNVWHGPDLSFDSQDPELTQKDAYGHGTHLASIMVGRDVPGTPASYVDATRFTGIAPDSRLVSVKVGASDGAVDVSQVVAAIDWVVANRTRDGLNIRVLNLSYGTDGLQDAKLDPLTYAVEQAWKKGIVVVVAGGNDGTDIRALANPARDPYVLAVGAADTRGTVGASDDLVPAWSSRGSSSRYVDLVAPGVSVHGLRVPRGHADERNPGAVVGTRFARASGTSQAAAVVSGAAALLLQEEPGLKPDQVKRQLMGTATSFSGAVTQLRGTGLVNVRRAQTAANTTATQSATLFGSGLGTLEGARGSSHVHDGVTELRGELDVFGRPWVAGTWAPASAAGTAFSGGTWRGATWTGDGWNARMWRGTTWTAGTWSARMWRDAEWSARMWRDGRWTSTTTSTTDTWSARMWRDAVWSARMWRSAGWSSAAWS